MTAEITRSATHTEGIRVKGMRAPDRPQDRERMSLNHASLHVALDGDRTETIENIVVELQDDIRHGRVTDDVSRLLAQRLEAAGVDMPPDAIDDLAEAIENDVSL